MVNEFDQEQESNDDGSATPFVVLSVVCLILVMAIFAAIHRITDLKNEVHQLQVEVTDEQERNRLLRHKVEKLERDAEFEVVLPRVSK